MHLGWGALRGGEGVVEQVRWLECVRRENVCGKRGRRQRRGSKMTFNVVSFSCVSFPPSLLQRNKAGPCATSVLDGLSTEIAHSSFSS